MNIFGKNYFSKITLICISASLTLACGEKQEVVLGIELEPAIVGGGGLGGGGGSVSVEECRDVAIPLENFEIVAVTQIIEAVNGIDGWAYNGGGVSATNDYPFTRQVFNVGDDPATVRDGQVAFQFPFSYPSNNYQFNNARLVIDTSRDSSDTEGIFVDGVFTGVPPNMVNTLSPNLTDPLYSTAQGALGGSSENSFFIDFSLSHYKQDERNTFDLSLADLLTPTSISSADVLSDGLLNVVTGDDSPVFQAYLVMRGLTIATEELTCTNSSTFSFTNVYLHEDDNTTGEVAFTGTTESPFTNWSNVGAYDNAEFYFDAPLPQVGSENITITTANLLVQAKKTGAGVAAITINGIGASSTGFDRDTATSAVETWASGTTTKIDTFMAAVTTGATGSNYTIDLVDLFGADQMRTLLAQGKLNIAVSGDLYFSAGSASADRDFRDPVSGPELKLDGTYFAEVCEIPDDANSPLSEAGFVNPVQQYEEVCEIVEKDAADVDASEVVSDGDGPSIASLQVLDITATTVKIVWSTNEGAYPKVSYGVGNTDTHTSVARNLSTFHQVKLTGLSPYKFYSFTVTAEDSFGNLTVTEIQTFRTLR